jgi:ABC-type transporter Mla subunit MlaD
MAKGRPTPQRIPDAVRDAVERTIQATVGSAQQTRGRAQGAVDDLVERAEASAEQVRQRVRGTRPVTHDELDEIHRDVRALGRRLDAIEKRLPKPRKPAAKKSTGARTQATSRKR